MSSPNSQFYKSNLPEQSKTMPSFVFTTGNSTALSISAAALENVKKKFESPETSQNQKKHYPEPTTIKPTYELTTDHLSAAALEKVRKLFESPENSQKEKPENLNPFDSTLSEGNKIQAKFDSPSETTVQTKELQTEEFDRKNIGKGVPVGVKAGIIRQNRGELSCGSSIQPKFVNIVNSNKLNFASLAKRKPESPLVDKKESKKIICVQKLKPGLADLCNSKSLKQYFPSLGLLVKAENAEGFVFKCKCFTSGCNCPQQGMYWEDFYDIMIQEHFKVSKDWTRHHYRLIIWKYASYERRLGACEGILSIKKVLENLKHRYEVEILQGKRSILKKIAEKDELPFKRMVLCVGCIKNQGKNFAVELTDGWHSIYTDVSEDSLFYPLIQRKVFFQGLKIEVFGSSLNEGKLSLNYNSVRRAAWHRRLGDVGNVFPFPVCISSVKEAGGVVGRITVYVAKIYPLLFIENGTIKGKFSTNEPTYSFFDCIVKDGIADFSKKKAASALVTVKHNAAEVYENLKVGKMVSFYFLVPQAHPTGGKTKHVNRKNFVFNQKSKVIYGKKERKDMIKVREIVHNKTKVLKEVDVIGIVTKVEKTMNNEVSALNLAGVHGNIKVQIHNPSFFGRGLNSVEASNFNYKRFLALFNVYVESKTSPVIEIKTSNYTEILHNNFPDRMKQQIDILNDFNLNTLLSHREECDFYGCVCGLG